MSGYLGKPGLGAAMHAETQSSLDEELQNHSALEKDEGNSSEGTVVLKLDQHGLPLVPQPSGFKDDPLVSRPGMRFRIHLSPIAELARLAEMDRPHPGQLHGVFRAIRLSRDQS